MKTLTYATPAWRRFVSEASRSGRRSVRVERAVAGILRAVRRDGDAALVRLTVRFDGVRLPPRGLRLSAAAVRSRAARAAPGIRSSLKAMARRIQAFHKEQFRKGFRTEFEDGSVLEEVVSPLESVGLYVPGGAGAYPSSVLMNAIPARVAGVKRILVATPPGALDENSALAAALVIAGLEDTVVRVGGAQAVAALAYGTRSVPAVAKIVGPGNAYVTEAKRQVRGLVGIDQDAGPSEVVILADDSADAGWVAADLLAQAEHGSGDERVLLVTPSRALAEEVISLVRQGVPSVANPAATRGVFARGAAVVFVADVAQGLAAVNVLAAEHVQVMTRRASSVARKVVGAAVFVGPHTPAAVGDYGIGPNHVLPTGGTARFASPLSVRDFQRQHSRVTMTRAGLARVTEDVVRVAVAEGFFGHAQSVLTRFEGE